MKTSFRVRLATSSGLTVVNGRVRDYELTPNDAVYGVQRCLQDESGVVERLRCVSS